MNVLDIFFVALLSSAILFLLFSFFLIVLRVSTGKQLKALPQRKIKNKRKRKKVIRARMKLQKKRKKQSLWIVLFFMFSVIAGGSAFYSRYYQMMHLTAEDSSAIAKSYYLVDELEKQMNSIGNGASPEKVQKNIRDLSGQLASTTVRKASGTLSVDKQRLLTRHYSLAQNLGINLSSLTAKDLENQTTRDTYLEDIKKVTDSQEKIFKEFGVNKSALEQKQ